MTTETVAAICDRYRRSQTAATEKAVELLRRGEIMALPTETVYGLAADARNAIAVAKIFEAKERPRFDPLIVHLPDRNWLERVAVVHESLVRDLVNKLWPGPFTIVLPKTEIIPDIVTAGLETVAVRISAHPVFSEIVSEFGGPLAAPSANRFGKVSPTTAQHVDDELHGRIPLIVDGGATAHGLESTVVHVTNGTIEILRPGPITKDALSAFGKVINAASPEKITAPGQLSSHYAPQKKLMLVDDLQSFAVPENKRAGVLSFREPSSGDFTATRVLSQRGDLREAAANLFHMLRELDADPEIDLIIAERVPEQGLGAAIMDRLRRAAHSDARLLPR